MSPSPSAPNASLEALVLTAILESAAAGILSIDQSGIIRTVNPATEKMFGYMQEEMIGRNVSMLMHGADHADHDAYIHRYLTTGESRIIGVGREVTGRRRTGALFPLHLSIGEFEMGGERYFTGVLIDLTKQKAAEERLADQQALFQAVFECLPDPLVITDPSHHVRAVNPAFTRVFGYTHTDLAGKPTAQLYARHDDWVTAVERMSGHCRDGDQPAHITDFKRADGEEFPGRVVASSIETESRRTFGHLDLIRDISGERRREAQLMQAQRMEAIGQLTGGIAHDFNNILTVVLGNVELLEMRLGSDEAAAGLAREAREAAEIGARLTDRLLTFGRRQMLETRHINLNEFVLGMMEILRRTIGEDIDVSTALASDLALTEVDAGEVENAVLNLAINARDAMPKGGRLVIETRNVELDEADVATMPELSPGLYVVLAVSDTGHGMSPEVRARAFEPFFTTKGGGTGKGTGLGLATIYGFVKQSGGHAAIVSDVDRGTTVELYLPAAPAADTVAADEPVAPSPPGGGGRRVLVVEDNESVRRLTLRRLLELGYEVSEASTGVAALEALAADPTIDLVFTDVVMPGGLTGVDLEREIERLFPAVRVLLTTGYSEEVLGISSESGRRLAVLRKPYGQAELARRIAEILTDPPTAGF